MLKDIDDSNSENGLPEVFKFYLWRSHNGSQTPNLNNHLSPNLYTPSVVLFCASFTFSTPINAFRELNFHITSKVSEGSKVMCFENVGSIKTCECTQHKQIVHYSLRA